jgi:hypothetical protein
MQFEKSLGIVGIYIEDFLLMLNYDITTIHPYIPSFKAKEGITIDRRAAPSCPLLLFPFEQGENYHC